MRNNFADTEVSEEGGGGGPPGAGAEIPLQPMENDGEQRFHLQPVEDPTLEQVEAPEGGCDPMGSPRWNKFLAGPVAPWREGVYARACLLAGLVTPVGESMLEQSGPKCVHLVEETHAGVVREEL
ncbi:AN1-type zinc finger protein 5-like [Grus japonensis]|uniref:AN1-type zinc finger protein 5-like n=1 Tax=Grus japonensis TaxID=30415 RepID=A0ABC9YCA2_GRUJA